MICKFCNKFSKGQYCSRSCRLKQRNIEKARKNLLDEINTILGLSPAEIVTYNETTIQCSVCSKILSIRNFYYAKRNNGRYRRRTECKNCSKNSVQHTYHSIDHYIINLLQSAKQSANGRKNRGRIDCGEFSLTKKDILDLKKNQNNKCCLSGMNLLWYTNAGWQKASIDRIDNSKGYTRDNIQLVAWCINQARSDMIIKDFLTMCRMVVDKNNVPIGQILPERKPPMRKLRKCPKCNMFMEPYKRKCTTCVPQKHCPICDKPIQQESTKCIKCAAIEFGKTKRKVERPTVQSLIEDIRATGYVQTGKKYGVRDNTIRKWIKSYGIDYKTIRKLKKTTS